MLRLRLVVVLCIVGAWLSLFGPVLLTHKTFSFRDAAHFYYPLFQWTTRQWAQGQVPLWNPQENCGMPVLADTSSSVLYPGKLVFVLPWFDFATKYELYITLHVLLAAGGMYFLARQFRTSMTAAGAGALSYAFCDNVLFQYCNVVFLVGAAWLPLAVVAAQRMLLRRRVKGAVALGAIMALMTLGGDPQAAYHAALMAALLAILLWRRRKGPAYQVQQTSLCHFRLTGFCRAQMKTRPWRRIVTHPVTLLAVAGASGAILAAVQILPAIEWRRHSHRATYSEPRNVYEIADIVTRPTSSEDNHRSLAVVKGLLGTPAPGSHHDYIYQFSVGPWRWPELIWPGFSGKMFPSHHRWLNVVGSEGRIWTPSLYMGLLPFLLALGSLRLRRGPLRQRWMSCCVLLAVLGSLGTFGLGWLSQTILAVHPNQAVVGEPVGGVYWLMVTLLPGYASFRYPAKLLVVAALGMSLLAARGWDRALVDKQTKLGTVLAWIAVTSFAGAALFVCTRQFWWNDWVAQVRSDALFGPLDQTGAASDLLGSLLHAGVLSTFFWALWRTRSRVQPMAPSLLPALALVITAVELSISQRWMVPSAPERIWQRQPHMAQLISDHATTRKRANGALITATGSRSSGENLGSRNVCENHGSQWETAASYRIYRGSSDRWYVSQWRRHGSPNRLAEWLIWEHDTLSPRFNLQTDYGLIGSYSSLTSRDFRAFIDVAKENGFERPDGIGEPHPAPLSALSVRYAILPAGTHLPGMQPIRSCRKRDERKYGNVMLWCGVHPFPRCWIVHDVQQLDPVSSRDPAELLQRTREALLVDGRLRDLTRSATVECAGGLPSIGPSRRDHESSKITVDKPHRVEIEAHLSAPGLLVLNDLYYPGWTVEVASLDEPKRCRWSRIWRTNRIMRGVFLPAGESRVVFRYQPASFRVGATVSVVGWLTLLIVASASVLWRGRYGEAK